MKQRPPFKLRAKIKDIIGKDGQVKQQGIRKRNVSNARETVVVVM